MLVVFIVFCEGIAPRKWCRQNMQHQVWPGEIDCFLDYSGVHQICLHTDNPCTKIYNVATVKTVFLQQNLSLTAFFDT